MRGVSLRLKINAAILVAFLAAACAFAAVLRLNMEDRLQLAHDRARVLLASVAARRLQTLLPLLEHDQGREAIATMLDHLLRVDDITEAALFGPTGKLLAQAGQDRIAPLVSGASGTLPAGRVFAVANEQDLLTATLIEPVQGQNGLLGFLRLRYSLHRIQDLNRRLWEVFGLAVLCAYGLLAGLLNLLLHRFVLRPVDTLRRAVEAVESGDLGTTVPVTSRDALGRLALAFNAMTARLDETSRGLRASQAAVEEEHRLLETRVGTRTAELAEANDRLVAEIAARRQAEDRLRQALAQRDALLDNSQVGLATNHDRIIDDINPRGAAILGYDREELLGRSVALLFPDKAAFEATVRDLEGPLATQAPVSLERQLLRRDGTLVWTRLHGKLVAGGESDATSDHIVVWAFDDITREKQRQGQLEAARRQAEDASRAKGSFLAVMSHEIRTPLNVIMGLTELLLEREGREEPQGFLRTINESAGHLMGIINDILDFSKIEAGKLALEHVHFDLPALLDAVARAVDVQANHKGLRFTLTVAEDVPVTLLGDPGRLRQVLLNLLGNAVKFTPHGSVSLDVTRLEPTAGAGDRVGLQLRVADTGIGIAPERMPDLFTSFQQGSGAIARRYGGTGLGLAISKEIVDRMGGHIEVRSEPGQGCVFTCTVFLAKGDPGKVTPVPEPQATAIRPQRPAARLAILLVEDNALNAAVIRLHLERLGHDLTVADSAKEAYGRLARQRFDTVLMDIEMPEIDGITATRTIRAGGPAEAPVLDPLVPILAVTAHAVEDVRSQCLEAGMNGFLTKPVNYQTLETILAEAIRPGRAGTPDTAGPSASTGPSAAAGTSPTALFDPAAAREAMGISWDQYVELSEVSFREGGSRLAEAGRALDADDLATAAIAVHTFKGASATLGAYSCRELAVGLEQAVRAGQVAAAREQLARLTALWDAVSRARDAWQAPTDAQDPA